MRNFEFASFTGYCEEAGDSDVSGGDAAAVAAAIADGSGDAGGDGGGSGGEGDKGGDGDTGWLHADGVKGEGDAPEWFKSDKYKSVDEQAKAYNELESKFGSFTGSPENFEVNISEELKEAGVEIDSDDPLMESAMKFAKDSNMDQKGFDGMVELYAMSQIAEGQAIEANKAEQMKALGNNAQTRVDNLGKWATANLSEDQFQDFQELSQTAAGVKVLEKMVSMTRAAPLNTNDGNQVKGGTEADVLAMQFEKDDNGNRRINTDPEFKKKYKELSLQVRGGEDHGIVIG